MLFLVKQRYYKLSKFSNFLIGQFLKILCLYNYFLLCSKSAYKLIHSTQRCKYNTTNKTTQKQSEFYRIALVAVICISDHLKNRI